MGGIKQGLVREHESSRGHVPKIQLLGILHRDVLRVQQQQLEVHELDVRNICQSYSTTTGRDMGKERERERKMYSPVCW